MVLPRKLLALGGLFTASTLSPTVLAQMVLQPDAAAPGMGTVVSIIAANGGFIGNELIETTCPDDILVGPSWLSHGAGDASAPIANAVLSTVFFVLEDAIPGECEVLLNGVPLAPAGAIDNIFSIVLPYLSPIDGGVGDADGLANGVIVVPSALRSDGGVVVFDSLEVPSGVSLRFDMQDPVPGTGGNEAYMPVIAMVRGDARIDGTLDVKGKDGSHYGDNVLARSYNRQTGLDGGDGGHGGPGGGGGGAGGPHNSTQGNGIGGFAGTGGNGFAGGSGSPSIVFDKAPGGAGVAYAPVGVTGGNSPFNRGGGFPTTNVTNGGAGGSGNPFGAGGRSALDGSTGGSGGYGGGGGAATGNNTLSGGGGGGFASAGTPGGNGQANAGRGGFANGLASLLPLMGGSGGGGGDGFVTGSGLFTGDYGGGGGGGGGGALMLVVHGQLSGSGTLDARGGKGGNGGNANNAASAGGGGSGGAVFLAARDYRFTGTIEVLGGQGGTQYIGNAGGHGGEGRVRIDGAIPALPPLGPTNLRASTYQGCAVGAVSLSQVQVISEVSCDYVVFDTSGHIVSSGTVAPNATLDVATHFAAYGELTVVFSHQGVPSPVGIARVVRDSDGDGVPDFADMDSDNDGIPDSLELGNLALKRDSDLDGVPDYLDPDFVSCTDANGDGWCDRAPASLDSDGDGVPDFLDLDSDNDGIPDIIEHGFAEFDQDRDGRVDVIVDFDRDGLSLPFDLDDNDPSVGALPQSLDSDNDGTPDFLDLDSDNDGTFDILEAGGVDSNQDGLVDAFSDANANGLAATVDPSEGGNPWSLPGNRLGFAFQVACGDGHITAGEQCDAGEGNDEGLCGCSQACELRCETLPLCQDRQTPPVPDLNPSCAQASDLVLVKLDVCEAGCADNETDIAIPLQLMNLGGVDSSPSVVVLQGEGGLLQSIPTESLASGESRVLTLKLSPSLWGLGALHVSVVPQSPEGECNTRDLSLVLGQLPVLRDIDEDGIPDACDTCFPSAELCDGIDNDCDGQTDEDYAVGEACSVGVGACLAEGTRQCVTLLDAMCDAQAGQPSAEVCDGLDNDCDGQTDASDADLVLVACENQHGVCGGAQKPASLCVSGNWQSCTAATYLAHNPGYAATDASCDGIDNNCDGRIDEGYGPTLTTCGVGVCANVGLSTCINGIEDATLGTCQVNNAAAGPELCDGLDNDCDGQTDASDADLVLVACENQHGVCGGAQKLASLCVSGRWQACDEGTYLAHNPGYAATDASCDGIDNNCDGQTDEAYVATATTCGVGACADTVGELQCLNGVQVDSCDPLAQATAERCDGIDNDCDGQTDEGFVDLSATCTIGVGACQQTGSYMCSADGAGTVCNAAVLAPTEELCDGIDNDCDGETDEDGACDIETEILSGPEAVSSSSSATFGFHDPLNPTASTFECRVDGGAWFNCEGGNLTVLDLADGEHTFEVRAVGVDGSRDDSPAVYTWVVNTVDPDTYVLSGPQTPSQQADASFSFGSNVENPSAWWCALDPESVPPLPEDYIRCDESWTFEDLGEGDHTLWVYVVDEYGTPDTTPATYEWTVDTTAPDTSLTSTTAGLVCAEALTFTFTGEAGSSFVCRLDGGEWQPCESGFTVETLADGSHTFEVAAIDAAGNQDPSPASVSFDFSNEAKACDACQVEGELVDANGDGIDDRCQDRDNDGIPDASDNCPSVANPAQEDEDNDGLGNACDGEPWQDIIAEGDGNCSSSQGGWLGLSLLALAGMVLRRRQLNV